MKQNNISGHCLFIVLVMASLLFLQGCSVNRRMEKKVNTFFKNSPVLNSHQVGFALSDLDKGQKIFEKDGDKFFIPASNAKLFTFYAGLKMLPDSVPSLRYIERGDSLIFWGTGDPSLLQSRLKGTNALNFLKSGKKQLFFAAGRYTDNFYGQGWSWDDYNDYYQAEITELPLMDNLVVIRSKKGKAVITPQAFNDCLIADSTQRDFSVIRDFNENIFRYPAMSVPGVYEQSVPYKTSTLLSLSLLSDTLRRPVQLINMKMPPSAKTLYSTPSSQVLTEMMLPSDNFIAEQLLLVYSNQFQAELNGKDAIRYIQDKYLKSLSGKSSWVDGSGLSRMNLFSPNDILLLLQLIDKEISNREKLFSMLPAGGKAGTLKNAYPKTDHPFVYGKTGTISNNYNQSGYLLTKKGRTLSFSFMNNNFVDPLKDVKQEMTKLITYIHDTF